MVKICTKCKNEKEITEFHKMKTMKDGYRGICKECRKEDSKLYRTINRDKINEKQRAYMRNNYEQEKERSYIWSQNNKEKIKERRDRWKLNNPDKVKKSIIKNNRSYQHKCRMFLHSTLKD